MNDFCDLLSLVSFKSRCRAPCRWN